MLFKADIFLIEKFHAFYSHIFLYNYWNWKHLFKKKLSWIRKYIYLSNKRVYQMLQVHFHLFSTNFERMFIVKKLMKQTANIRKTSDPIVFYFQENKYNMNYYTTKCNITKLSI